LPHAYLWEPGCLTFAVFAVLAEEIISKNPTEGCNAGAFYIPLLHMYAYSNVIPKVLRILSTVSLGIDTGLKAGKQYIITGLQF